MGRKKLSEMTDEERARHRAAQDRWKAKNADRVRAYQAEWRRRARAEGRPSAEAARERKRSPEYREKANAAKAQEHNREKARAYVAEYRKTPAGRLKNQARNALNWAIQSGKITRPDTCERCGTTPPRGRDGRSLIRADHHKGYDKAHWLDVRWICTACDGEVERERKAAHQAPPVSSDI